MYHIPARSRAHSLCTSVSSVGMRGVSAFSRALWIQWDLHQSVIQRVL